jgi:hypothetical protein
MLLFALLLKPARLGRAAVALCGLSLIATEPAIATGC